MMAGLVTGILNLWIEGYEGMKSDNTPKISATQSAKERRKRSAKPSLTSLLAYPYPRKPLSMHVITH
jgi:hypothetical protein